MENTETPAAAELPKPIQIIPAARGWHVRPEPGALLTEIACWALLANGEVVPMVASAAYRTALEVVANEGSIADSVYTPGESFEYRGRYGTAQPDDDDWEFVTMDYDPEGNEAFTMWRRPRR